MTVELIEHAEKLYANLVHPNELRRRKNEHESALMALRNGYIEACHAENQRYLLRMTKLVNEHDVKAMGAKALPTYETSQYADDFVDE